jgi:hypothetical protein
MRAFCLTNGWVSSFWIMCMLAFLPGCQSTPNAGPIYRLRDTEIPEAKTPVAVSIADKRPDSERTVFLGSVDLTDYGNAVDILTIDNFEPHPIELLKKSLAAHLSTLALAPTWAEVDLTSFRVVVNRTEIMAVEYERQKQMSDGERMAEQRRLQRHYNQAMAEYRKACRAAKKNGDPPPVAPTPPPSYLPPSAAPATGVGVGLAVADGNGMGGVIGGIGAGLLAAAIVSDMEEERPVIRHAAAIETPSGVSCKIVMHVRLHWPDGRREEFDIASEAHTPPPRVIEVGPEDPSTVLRLSVIPTVQQAMKQASIQLSTKGAAFLGRQPVPPTEKPSRPAHPTKNSEFEILPEAQEANESAAPLPQPKANRLDKTAASGSSRL